MSHVAEDVNQRTFKSVHMPQEDAGTATDWRCDQLPVLKLQAPPKAKCKRQLSSEPDVPSSVIVSETLVQTMKLACPSGREDKTQLRSKRDCSQLKAAPGRFHNLSSSLSLSSNFSPKKFKSHAEHAPPITREHVPAKSTRQTSIPQLMAGCRQVLDSSSSREHFSSVPLAKLRPDKSINTKSSCHHEVGKRDISTYKPQAYVPCPKTVYSRYAVQDYVRSESLINKSYPAVQISPTDGSVPNTQMSAVKKVESAFKQWNTEPDVFVFPDTGSDDAINLQLASESPCTDNTDEPDGLDSPMDTEEYCSKEHSEKLLRQSSMFQNFGLEHSTMQSVSRPFINSSSLSSKREPHILNSYQNFSDSTLNDSSHRRGHYTSVFHTQPALEQSLNLSSSYLTRNVEKDILVFSGFASGSDQLEMSSTSSNSVFSGSFCNKARVGSASQRVPSSSQYSWTFLNLKNEQGHGEPEILDISESDDTSSYLEQDGSFSCDRQTYIPCIFTRKSDANNNRISYGSMGRRARHEAGDNCPVTTTADTNVCYISLNESGSPLSSDDMEYLCDTSRSDRINSAYSKSYSQQDVWDETDGKSEKLCRMQEADNKLADHLHQSLDASDKKLWHKADAQNTLATGQHGHTNNYRPNSSNCGTMQFDVAEVKSPSIHTGTLKKEEMKLVSRVISDQTACHLNKNTFKLDSSVQSSGIPDQNKNMKHFSPATYKHLSLMGCDAVCVFLDTENRNVTYSPCCKTIYNNVDNTYRDHFIDDEDEKFADEVDGLGDEKKKSCQSFRDTSPKPGPHEQIGESVVHCFDENIQTDVANSERQSAELTRGSKCASSSRDASQTAQEVKQITASQREMLDPWSQRLEAKLTSQGRQERHLFIQAEKCPGHVQKEMFERNMNKLEKEMFERDMNKLEKEMFERDTNKLEKEMFEGDTNKLEKEMFERDTNKLEKEMFERDMNKLEKEMFERDTNKLEKEMFERDTNKLGVRKTLTDITYSPDLRVCRRKSDTSLGDVTGTCMSRSQSSPSKLDMTEDNFSDMKKVIFHRPWQDQPTRECQSLPRLQKRQTLEKAYTMLASASWNASASMVQFRRMMCPTGTDSASAAHSDDMCETAGKSAQMNISLQPCLRPKEESKQSGVSDLNTNLIAGLSADSGKHSLDHHLRPTEARSKRKLAFCKDDSWNQPPTRQEACPATSGQHGLPSLESREPVSNDARRGYMSREQETTQRRDEDRTLDFHQDASASSSRQPGPYSGFCPRSQDEVDVRVQVWDVRLESLLLRQRLDRIYQADDRSCECSRIEQHILSIALQLFQILDNDVRENWMVELRATNHAIRCALDLAASYRRLCAHGRRVTDLFSGSVVIRMKCRTLTSVVDLCDLHASGDLHQILYKIFMQCMTSDQPYLTLRVILDKKSVETCQEYFLTRMDGPLKTRSGTRARSPKKVAAPRPVVRSTENLLYSSVDPVSPCRDIYNSSLSSHGPAGILTPKRERKFSFGEINRTAFQELNISDVSSPKSPSLFRHVRDDVFLACREQDLTLTPPYRLNSPTILTSPKLLMSPGSSPLTSPRRLKVCDVISERENIGQDDE